MVFNNKRRVSGAILGILLTMLLTGCGSGTKKITEAMECVQVLDYAGALTLFDEAQEAREDQRLIARGRGLAYMGLTEYTQAIANFREALSLSDGFVEDIDFDLNYYLAAACIKDGQLAEAQAAYNAILSLRPEEEEAYFLRGNVRLGLGDDAGAREDFDRVVSMDAKNYERLIAIYQALSYYGYEEIGRDYLQEALLNADKNMTAYDTGRIYYYLGEYQKAYIALEEAKEKGGAESYLYLGKAYEATGDYNYASSVYNNYLSKDTQNAEIYNQLGLCEMAKGEYRKALEAFQTGKQIEDSKCLQELSFNEIVAYEYLGEYSKAAVLLEDYLKNYPDDTIAGREQQFLSTR